jgi:hypothetical protein
MLLRIGGRMQMASDGKNHALATKYDFVGRCTTICTESNQNFVEKLEFLNTGAGLLQGYILTPAAFMQGSRRCLS